MKIDLYTKVVLTVIALALAVIALQQTIPSVMAQSGNKIDFLKFAPSGALKVTICDPVSPILCTYVSDRGVIKTQHPFPAGSESTR